ncbi:unnamed protein product, partial [Discosporangium mesarthrocarpum]
PPSATPTWRVTLQSREESDVQLALHGPDSLGRLPPTGARSALLGTGAGEESLRRIWELSDVDKDGFLDREEFALAWFLAKRAAAGHAPPAALEPDMVPPSKRPRADTSAANPF